MSSNRAIWRYVSAVAVSNLGDGMLAIGLPLLVLHSTQSPQMVALVAAAGRLPWLLLAIPVGILIDRVNRLLLMTVAQVLRVVLLVGALFFLSSGSHTPAVLVTLAFLLGTLEVTYDSSAQTAIPSLFPGGNLTIINTRAYGAESLAGNFVGPILGAYVVATGRLWLLIAAAACYLVAAGIVRSVEGPLIPVAPKADGVQRGLGGILLGVTYLFKNRTLLWLALLVAINSLALGAVNVVLPIHATSSQGMDLSEVHYGILTTAAGVGAFIGVLVAKHVIAKLPGRLIIAGVVVSVSVAHAALFTKSPVIAGCALAVSSLAAVVWNVISVTYRQTSVPNQMLGRVNTVYRSFAWGASPIGALAAGYALSYLPTGMVFLCIGVFVLFGLLLVSGVHIDDEPSRV